LRLCPTNSANDVLHAKALEAGRPAQDVADEDDQAQEQESNPDTQPEDTPTADAI
jgi:hypothetical protein